MCFCIGCNTGEIRLAGGTTEFNGRLEVCVNQQWGTVCDAGTWGNVDASVVCRQFGFSGISKHYGQ